MTTIIDTPNYQFVEATHTKKESKLYVIQLKNRVEDKFKLLTKRVENHGGYYSGHQKGFVFNRILSQKEIDEIFKGIFFEEKVELQKVDENKDAWNYTLEELKSIPVSKRGEDTFNFKYNLDGKLVNYSIKVPSGSTDDAFISLAKKIIGNALMSGKYNKAVEKGEITPVRAAQIIKSLGYSLEQINQDFVELHPDIQAVWSMKKANQEEVLDKVRFPYLYERSEMSHLSDKRYSQIINDAIDSNKYEKLIKEGTVSANKVAFIIESAGFEIPEGLLGEAISERKEEIESLVGGYADSQSIYDISEKHSVPIKEIIRQFKKGLKVEREHTKDKQKMGEIVKDHLVENPYYYDVLIAAEKTMEELDPSKFKSHDEYMKAFSEKEKELEGLSVEEKVELKARTIIDKIKYAHKQIGDGVPDEVESFLKNQILNHFVSLFNEVVSEYIFYTPVWLDLQNEYLTESQRNKMLMYGIYNNAHYEEDVVNKFIENVIDSEMIFGSENKKLNNIFNLLPYSPFEVPSELEYDLNPKDKNLAEIVDAFVNKTKVLTSTLGVYFGKDGVFASKFTLDIFLKGKKGYLPKNNIEEGIYGLSNSAKNILPAYGAKRLNMLKDKKAIQFFQEYMATYGNEKGEFDKGISVLTHDQIQTMFKDMSVVYWNKAYKDYVKKEVDGLKLKVSSYSVLYIKQGANLFTICLHDFIEALAAIIKMGIDTVQFGVSKNGLYISENVSSLIRLEESGIRVSIKSNESEMPHGMLYYDLNKKEFLTNKVENDSMEDGSKMARGGGFNPKVNFITNMAFKQAMIENGVSTKKADNVIWHLGSDILRTKKEIRDILEGTNDRHFDYSLPMLEKHKERISPSVINKIIGDSIYYSKKHFNKNNGVIKFKNQYYLTSNDEIKEGDWFYWKDSDGETEFIAQASVITDGTHIQVKSDNEFGYGDWNKDYAKKIISSDDGMFSAFFGKQVEIRDTKYFINQMMENGGDVSEKPKVVLHNNTDSVYDLQSQKVILAYMKSLNDSGKKVFINFLNKSNQNIKDYETVFYLNKNYHTEKTENVYGDIGAIKHKLSDKQKFYSNKLWYRKTAEEAYNDALNSDDESPSFIRIYRHGNIIGYAAVTEFDLFGDWDGDKYDEKGYLKKELKEQAIKQLKKNLFVEDISEMKDGGDVESDEKKWVDCPRCGGSGELPMYRHINAGKCYECGGKGLVPNKSATEIAERMRLSKIKYTEKKKIENENQNARYERVHRRREEFAIDFNNKIIEKVIIPNTTTDNLLKRTDFQSDISLAESRNVSCGEDFIKVLKDFDKRYLDYHFNFQLEKYLREKYNYYGYLKNKLKLEDFFFSFNTENISDKEKRIIRDLQYKYRDEFDKIGRYDDDVIEDRPSGSKMKDGGLLTKKRRNKLVIKPYTGYEFAKYLKKLGYIEKDGSYKVEVLVIGDGDENDRTFEIELYDYDSVSAIGTNFYDEDQDTMEVFFKDIEYVLKDLNA